MDWSNWTTYLGQVLDFILGLVPKILNLIMSSPIIGVPVIIGIIGIALSLVLKFVGAFGSSNKKEE